MLKKLLKYDIENIFKVLIIFYSLALFFAVLTRLFLNIENSFILNIIGKICSGVLISMIFNIIINNLMRVWIRFKNNFFGDESYLTHTLPVEKKTLYLSKILTAIITLFVSVLVSSLSLFIAYYSKDFMLMLKESLGMVASIYNSSIIQIILMLLFVLFIEFTNILQCGFTGILLGNKMNNNKIGYSVLYGFVSFWISQIIVMFFVFIAGVFNKDIMNLIFTNELININSIKIIIYLAIIFYVILIIIGYILNIKLFKKGVNVD